MTTTIDPSEVAKFEAMAAEWWDPEGKFKPLHLMNPCRLDYITSQVAAEFGRDLAGQAQGPADVLRVCWTTSSSGCPAGRAPAPDDPPSCTGGPAGNCR